MKFKNNRFRLILGYICFFLVIALTVTVAMLIYSCFLTELDDKSIAAIMFAVIVALSGICTAIDALRRKFAVSKPVNKILAATDKIAAGDFSVRLEIKHSLNDYNEFDCIAENLNLMAKELSKNEVLKSDFISNVSHEIKTPLSIIQNYAAALQNEKLNPEERRKYAQTLVQASKRLSDLVVNILRLNKLENQQLPPEYASVKLDEQLAQCIFTFEDLLEKKNLQLDCDIDEVTVITSPSHLELVWNNLLSNAIKFTPDGGKISVSLKSADGKAIIKVADSGCGISPETGKRIFDKFYQGDASHAKEGNGLGLALVKRVIDILGGEISVESELGKGTVFTVALKGEAGYEER